MLNFAMKSVVIFAVTKAVTFLAMLAIECADTKHKKKYGHKFEGCRASSCTR